MDFIAASNPISNRAQRARRLRAHWAYHIETLARDLRRGEGTPEHWTPREREDVAGWLADHPKAKEA